MNPRNDARRAGATTYTDACGDIRRVVDNHVLQSARPKIDAERAKARKMGRPNYVDEFGFLRSTQHGHILTGKPKPPRVEKRAPPAKPGLCEVHGRTVVSVSHGRCLRCYRHNGHRRSSPGV